MSNQAGPAGCPAPVDGPFTSPLQEVFGDPMKTLSTPMTPAQIQAMNERDAAKAAAGYTVDDTGLAQRIGELRAVADAVESAAGMLDSPGGDLGPGDIGGAVSDLADQWRDGLGNMRDRINDMADAVNATGASYANVEAAGEQKFQAEYGVRP